MNNRFPNATVSDYKGLISRVSLSDPNDRHVMAAAMASNANFIVTDNVRDFAAPSPFARAKGRTVIEPIEVVTPDEFLSALYLENRPAIERAIAKMAKRRNNPPTTREQLMGELSSGYFPGLVAGITRDDAERRARQTLRRLEAESLDAGLSPAEPSRGANPVRLPHIPMKQLDADLRPHHESRPSRHS